MELYKLDQNFNRVKHIDKFTSLIWTERYSTSGDVTLVVPATPDNINLLLPDTRLGEVNSEETMVIDTMSIQNELLTVTGKSLVENVLMNRAFRYSTVQAITSTVETNYPSAVITGVVTFACGVITGFGYEGELGGLLAEDELSNLTVVNADPDLTTSAQITVSTDSVFAVIESIAAAFNKGIKLIGAPDGGSYQLTFTAYAGLDRTSDQSDNPVVRFSNDTKSLVGTTELYSNQNFRNICYAYSSSMPSTVTITDPGTGDTHDETLTVRMGKGVIGVPDTVTDFDRKVVMVDYTDFTIDKYAANLSDGTSMATLEALIETELDIAAYNALLNYTFTKSVDGEVVPQSQWKYGVDYFLGDVIELQGASGLIQNARVTEYIRSQDATGEKAYPTVAVTG